MRKNVLAFVYNNRYHVRFAAMIFTTIVTLAIGFYECSAGVDPINAFFATAVVIIILDAAVEYCGMFSLPVGEEGFDSIPYGSSEDPVKQYLFDCLHSRNKVESCCRMLDSIVVKTGSQPFWERADIAEFKNGFYGVFVSGATSYAVVSALYLNGKWRILNQEARERLSDFKVLLYDVNNYSPCDDLSEDELIEALGLQEKEVKK